MHIDRLKIAEAGHSKLFDFFSGELSMMQDAETKLEQSLGGLQTSLLTDELCKLTADYVARVSDQVNQLANISLILNVTTTPVSKTMDSLLQELNKVIEKTEQGSPTRDAAVIIILQKIVHYKIASYGSLEQLATTLGLEEVSDTMLGLSKAEKDTDLLLTDIAERRVNWLAETEKKDGTSALEA